jgi:hypothetical protein
LGSNSVPIVFWTSLELDLLLTRCWGPIAMDDFRQALSRLKSDRHYKPGRTELTDLTGAHQVDANFGNLWSVLNDVNNQVPGTTVRTRTVLILPDEAMYGVGRMYQSLAENSDGIEVEIHRSADAALAALGLSFCTIDELFERNSFLPHTPV